MVGRKRIGEQAMTAAERQRRRRQLAEARAQRAEEARVALEEATITLTSLWNRLNGNKKFREVHKEIGQAGDLCRRAYLLLKPVLHLPVSKDEPRRLIRGSSDFENVTNSLAFILNNKELRCPECERRRHEFY